MNETLGGLYAGIALFLLVLAILWFFLPFAIFGTKDKLNQLILETQETNEELRRIRIELSGTSPLRAPTEDDRL